MADATILLTKPEVFTATLEFMGKEYSFDFTYADQAEAINVYAQLENVVSQVREDWIKGSMVNINAMREAKRIALKLLGSGVVDEMLDQAGISRDDLHPYIQLCGICALATSNRMNALKDAEVQKEMKKLDSI